MTETLFQSFSYNLTTQEAPLLTFYCLGCFLMPNIFKMMLLLTLCWKHIPISINTALHVLMVSCFFTSVAQLCPTVCDPMDCSPPGSSVHGILQARMLAWVAVSFCTLLLLFSCYIVSDSLRPHGLQHARLPCPSPTPRVCSNSCPSSW